MAVVLSVAVFTLRESANAHIFSAHIFSRLFCNGKLDPNSKTGSVPAVDKRLDQTSNEFDPLYFDEKEIQGVVARDYDTPTLLSGKIQTIRTLFPKDVAKVEKFKAQLNFAKYWRLLRDMDFHTPIYPSARHNALFSENDFMEGVLAARVYGGELQIERDGSLKFLKNHGWGTDDLGRTKSLDAQGYIANDYEKLIAFYVDEVRRLTGNESFSVPITRTTPSNTTIVASYSHKNIELHTVLDIPSSDEGLLFLSILGHFQNAHLSHSIPYLKSLKPITVSDAIKTNCGSKWFEAH